MYMYVYTYMMHLYNAVSSQPLSNSVVDLSHNRLDDPAMQQVISAMPELVSIIHSDHSRVFFTSVIDFVHVSTTEMLFS